jgi:cytochrome c-type biogenesis protein CcmH
VLLAVVAVALGIGVQRPAPDQTLEQRTLNVAADVRCPVCVGETVAESSAAPSVAIRNEIRADLAAGEKPSAILAGLAVLYGPGILEKPAASGTDLLLWVLPVVATLAAAGGLAAAFVWWGRRRRTLPVSEADLRLVEQALGPVAGEGP